MSKAGDTVRAEINKYLSFMGEQDKKPSCVHITQKQFDTLRKEFNGGLKSKGKAKEKDKASFRPRFRGHELRLAR